MIIKSLYLWIFLLSVSDALAQVNTEKFRSNDEDDGLSTFIELSGTFKTGNAEQVILNVNGRMNWTSGKATTFFIFENEYEWAEGERLINEQLLHIRNTYGLNNLISSELYGQINLDKKLRINNRELIGAGLLFSLIHVKHHALRFGTSFMFEHENYNLPSDALHPRIVNGSRWSNYISVVQQFASKASLTGVIYYQPLMTSFSDYRLLNENTLNLPITTFLSFTVTVKIRYDSKPADGIKLTDTKTNVGIVFQF